MTSAVVEVIIYDLDIGILSSSGILVPVTASTESVRQDSSTWRDVISGALQELDKRTIFAQQLKIALKRDELTNETHDNFVHFILGTSSTADEGQHYITINKAQMLKLAKKNA